jgi:serine/threonine-protein kinase
MRLGRYEILAPLGGGGMGEVFKARHQLMDRVVALKLIKPELLGSPDIVRRFQREIRAAAQLAHPNIIMAYDAEEVGDKFFLVMEYCAGVNLGQLIRQSGPLAVGQACETIRQAALGLQHASERGILHPDIKPENLLITEAGVKILDLGLARLRTADAAAESLTLKGAILGTPDFMAPEQADNPSFADARSDLYSLGCTFYFALSGQVPFHGGTLMEKLVRHRLEEPVPLGRLRSELPPEIIAIVQKLMAKQPADRFQTPAELAAAVKPFASEFSAIRFPAMPSATDTGTVSTPIQATVDAPSLPLNVPLPQQRPVVRRASPSAENDRPKAPRRRRDAIPSLAVLPLANTNADLDTEYLSDGITESIINLLSQLTGLRVMARSTAFRYKGRDVDAREVGRALKVRAVLTGQILQRDKRLIIKMELVNVKDGSQLWGERYNRELSDILAVEKAIAQEIVEKLRLRLTPDQKKRLRRPSSNNPEAYQLYLKGRYHWNKRTVEDFGKSIKYFQQAIEQDPVYALAYAGLAETHATLGSWGASPPKTEFPVAKRFAEQARQLEEGLAEAHAVLAYISMAFDWNWPDAEAGLQQAIRLNPGYSVAHARYAYLLMILGRFDEALGMMRRAQKFEPLSLNISSNIGYILYFLGHYDQAIDQLRMTLAIDESFPSAHYMLGLVFERQGKYGQAIEAFQKAVSLGKGVPNDIYALGQVYAVSGQRDGALQVRDELLRLSESRYVPPSLIGLSYINLGEDETGFSWLERAYDGRDFYLLYLGIDPRLAGVHTDPRFTDLLRRMNFAL